MALQSGQRRVKTSDAVNDRLLLQDGAPGFRPDRWSRLRRVANWRLLAIALFALAVLSTHLFARLPPEAGAVVWSSNEGLTQSFLPAPHDSLRLTLIHSVVRRRNETYGSSEDHDIFLSTSFHIEKRPYYHDKAHQIYTTDARDLLDTVSCHFVFMGRTYTSSDSEFRHFSQGMLLNHQIPAELSRRMAQNPRYDVSANVRWQLKGTAEPFEYHVVLKGRRPPATSEVGVCLSPIYGHIDVRATIEWRENLRRLGVNTVHWHGRDASIGDFVHRYNTATGARDTFMYSPPTSLESYGRPKDLPTSGLYADQVIYYMSCRSRSHATAPTRWLAFIDLDEEFMPTDLSIKRSEAELANLVPDYFSNIAEDIGSQCFCRALHGRPLNLSHAVSAEIAATPPLKLSDFQTFSPPSESGVKCVRRMTGSEYSTVHDGDDFYRGYHQEPCRPANAMNQSLMLLHRGRGGRLGEDPPPFGKDGLEVYLADLWTARERVIRKMDWPCTDVPCRFAPPPLGPAP